MIIQSDKIKTSLIAFLEGQIQKHIMNVQIQMQNPVGVAEHPDTLETIEGELGKIADYQDKLCLLYTSPSPRDLSTSRMPSSA